MAPFPEEIDVFSEPHSRMKQLVEVYSEKLSSTDFLNDQALQSLLHSLQQTFFEFKTHEQIENRLIMRKLKNKLKALSIHDATVCNCHNDSKLLDMLALVRDGYWCTGKPVDRQNYALKLQNALNEFTQDFIPHMREEEEVFQPLLMKYFEYDELKLLKERVLQEHTNWQKEHLVAEVEKEVGTKSDKGVEFEHDVSSPFSHLPPELVSHVFSFLSPFDLVQCSEVCKSWNTLAYDISLWKHLNPCQWAAGNWNWKCDPLSLDPEPPSCMCLKMNKDFLLDEDADHDDESDGQADTEATSCGYGCLQQQSIRERNTLAGIIQFLLNKVGPGIQSVYLSQSTALTSRMLLSILKNCPNLQFLDVSYTSVTDAAFKRLQDSKACQKLEHLDLSGCSEITDLGLKRLAACFKNQPKCRTVCSKSPEPWRIQPWECNVIYGNPYCDFLCQYCPMTCLDSSVGDKTEGDTQTRMKLLSLSGCYQITDLGIRYLSNSNILARLEHLDVSGCWKLTGPCLEEAVSSAPELSPEGLYYCNYIEDGPFQDQANGCDNLECNFRACCCKGN